MDHLVSGVGLVFSRKDSRLIVIGVTLLFFFLLLLIQNGEDALTALSFNALPTGERLALAFSALFNITDTFTVSSLLLSVLGSLLGGINISLAYTYVKTRSGLLIQSGLYSGTGLFFALLGIHCAACGTALLAVFLSFLGLSGMLAALPYQGQEFGYIGIIFLCMATYSLSLKVNAPGTC